MIGQVGSYLLYPRQGEHEAHPRDCSFRILKETCLIGQHEQFAEMRYSSLGEFSRKAMLPKTKLTICGRLYCRMTRR